MSLHQLLWDLFWHAKDFLMSSEVDVLVGEIQPGFIWWLTKRSRISGFFIMVFFAVFYYHFRTFGECEACLIVCPSAVNFGTMWSRHKVERWVQGLGAFKSINLIDQLSNRPSCSLSAGLSIKHFVPLSNSDLVANSLLTIKWMEKTLFHFEFLIHIERVDGN